MQSRIGVIIVNYNAGLALKECVDSLVMHTQSEVRIVIVDNASTDDSLNATVTGNTEIKTVRNDCNVGYAKACNQAVAGLDADYLVFLNPDCCLTQPVIEPMVQQLENNHSAAIIGCRVNNFDGSEQIGSRRRLPSIWRLMCTYLKLSRLPLLGRFFSGVNLIHQPMPEKTASVQAVSGAYFIIRSADFHELEGFDANYPLHFEDLDLFRRVLNQRRCILFDPCLSIKHHKGLSSVDNKQVLAWKKYGLNRYFQKHHGKIAATLVRYMARLIG